MEVLKLINEHFSLTVETQRPAIPFSKAISRHSDITASTRYVVPPDTLLQLWSSDTNELISVDVSILLHPVFFENRLYHFAIEFKENVSDAKIITRNKDWEEGFTFRKYGNVPVLTGSVNFGNDIGKYNFKIQYRYNAELIEKSLEFEVFPIKLDYKTDYRKIVADIQEAYPNLVLDFLRKTYQQFQSTSSSTGNELIWWSIFEHIFKNLIENFQFVVKNPHRRLQEENEWLRPEKIRRAQPMQEEMIHRNRHIPNRRYLVNRKVLRTNTFENRFVKVALGEVIEKFHTIKDFVISLYRARMSESYTNQLALMDQELSQLKYHPFFRDIKTFEGFNQESLVLQRKTGYSSIFRNWILLKKGYSFFEGANKMELKDIAELYQIWCFLEMKEMIKSLLGKEPEQVELAELKVSQFRVQLKEGKKSRISFIGQNGEEIELFHELQYLNEFDRHNQTGSYTSVQKPDIVLRIHKKDLLDNQAFTYLFDAKYRLASDDDESLPDAPPEDAINQMHRYRDAIYFNDSQAGYRAKEVIGGYILYPGRDDQDTIRKNSQYFKSIHQVNIGAFPLLAGYESGKNLILEHLSKILQSDSETLLKEATPQRGKFFQPDNGKVIIGIVGGENPGLYEEYLESTQEPELHFYQVPRLIEKESIKYFAPYIKGKGIKSYYLITGFYKSTRNQIYRNHGPLQKNDTSAVYVLKLQLEKVLPQYFKPALNIRLFHYLNLSAIRNMFLTAREYKAK